MTNLNTFQRKNSKRWIGITAACILMLAVAAYFLYKPLLVYTISHALADTDSVAPAYLGRYGKQIQKYKKPINKASEQVIHELDSLHIPFEVFLKTIDEMDKQEILKTLSEIERLKPQTSNEVFNITKNNITVTAFDMEIFRKPFLKFATMPRIHKALRYIDDHHIAEELDISVSREIIKKVMIQKREEIASKLKNSSGITTH